MKSKLMIRVGYIIIMLLVFIIGLGCELPGSSSGSSDTTAASGTGGTGGSGGDSGGTQSTGQLNGTWQGAYQETSNNMPGPLLSGIFHFNFSQNSNTSFSGSGYF